MTLGSNRFALVALLLVPVVAPALSACTPTVSQIRLDADKALVVAQTALLSAQQTALAGIRSGAITGERKNRIIDLLADAKQYETTAYDALSTGKSDGGDVAALYAVLAQLSALGVKGN